MADLLYIDKKRKNAAPNDATLILRHLKKYKDFTDKDIVELSTCWSIRKIKKNDYLFREGETIREIGFLLKGAVKFFKEKENACQVLAMFTEGDLCTLTTSSYQNEIAGHSARCTENSIFISIDHKNILKLIKDRPAFLKYFDQQNESVSRFLMNRVTSLQMLSAQERYEDLNKNYPEIFARFNLQDVANYLGMKAETLSRVRNPSLKKAS